MGRNKESVSNQAIDRILCRRVKSSRTDIGVKELEQLYDEIDSEIKKNGLPAEEKLRAEIEGLNRTQ